MKKSTKIIAGLSMIVAGGILLDQGLFFTGSTILSVGIVVAIVTYLDGDRP